MGGTAQHTQHTEHTVVICPLWAYTQTAMTGSAYSMATVTQKRKSRKCRRLPRPTQLLM